MKITWNTIFNFWTVNFIGWSIYSLVNFPAFIISQRISFKYFLAAQASTIAGFLITSGFRYYYKKIKITSYNIFKISFIVVFISVLFASLWYVLDSLSSYWIHGREEIFKEEKILLVIYYIVWGAFVFVSWSTLYITINLWRKWEQEKLNVEKANKLALNSQLNALRYQLNPHFLFNSLSSLRAVIESEPKIAKLMIDKLSEFLQYTFRTNDASKVSLIDELENVEAYLEIEKVRFGNNLIVNFNIDQLAEEYPVPPFILNPIVENAVKYGYDTSEDKLEININANVEKDKSLILSVENSGKWIENSDNNSMGIKNIRKRLEIEYGNHYEFNIEKLEDSIKIIIKIKYKE